MNTKTNLLLVGGLLAALCNGIGQPIITTQPQSQLVSVGADVTFSVSASGFEPFSYQWRRSETTLAGETNATLTLTNVQLTHAASFTVVVTDGFGDATTSETARLTVHSTFTRVTTGPIATDAAHSFGCAWGDYDGDGYLDLMVGNGLGDANALYHNEGDGTFTRVTTGPIATTIGDNSGITWGDYDNDGNLDLFAANWQLPSFLFRNDGNGNFTRIINGSMGSNSADSSGCAWGDYDNDGFLDLVVANQNQQNEYLYRNNRDGKFTQILNGPVANSGGNSSVPHWADYDNDGHLDLLVPNAVNGSVPSLLFHNDGEGGFTVVQGAGLGGGNISDWADYDNDGDLDLFISVGAGGPGLNNALYRNDGDGIFTRIFESPVVNSGALSQGCSWGDYDNDGWLDLFVSRLLNQSGDNFLFHNNGDGTFTRVRQGSIVSDGGYSGSCAWADYDNDGFLDLFVASGGAVRLTDLLYHNDGNSNQWLSVRCVGSASNRSGVGAKVRVKALIGGIERWQLREISSGCGYNGSGLRAHFGLGDATNVDLVRVEWPSGTVKEWRNVAVNQMLTLKEPPTLAAVGITALGAFQMNLKGGRLLPYTVEYSTNLAEWRLLTNFNTTNILTPIQDPNASGSAGRFYRALQGN